MMEREKREGRMVMIVEEIVVTEKGEEREERNDSFKIFKLKSIILKNCKKNTV